MLYSVEQAFVGRDERRAPLKTPSWEAIIERAFRILLKTTQFKTLLHILMKDTEEDHLGKSLLVYWLIGKCDALYRILSFSRPMMMLLDKVLG